MDPSDHVQWHTLDGETACALLGSRPSGLSEEAAADSLARFGPNELQSAPRSSPWTLFIAQFKNVLIVILVIACLLSLLLGQAVEAVTIGVIVLFAALLGFAQEWRAERAVEMLATLAAPTATVIRDGAEKVIPARELVPGDVVLLHAGDRVPADLRLTGTVSLKVEESSLTGESAGVEKGTPPLANPELPLAERSNMAYAGTAVSYGRGRGVAVATGMQTEFGRIAGMLSGIQRGRTPLQENLDKVGTLLARAAVVGVAVIVALGLLRGEPFLKMFLFGIALAVAVVPEALPAVVTISLALGVQRMVKRHALMRRLAAVETLGSTTVICSDKTGTLTRDEMTVRRVVVAGDCLEVSGAGYQPEGEFSLAGTPVTPTPELKALLQAAVLCSDAELFFNQEEGRYQVKGDATEAALVVAAAKAGLERAELQLCYPRVGEIPFTSETKRMTTLHADGERILAYAKGAPEVILAACDKIVTRSGVLPLDESRRSEIAETARDMAASALRVLAVASKPGAGRDECEREMALVGLVGMFDPPRPEAAQAIATCREAGILPVMITGDHPATARAVAVELGLLTGGSVVTGAELDRMDEADLAGRVSSIQVYARVSPAHKLRVVSALQGRGEVVAMTGDGVNDAPALKKADIGIAMGITGTAVSREAAAMTLTDDNFASIVAAVEEGRAIFDNIKKYLMYLLSSNIGEIGLMAGALLLGLPLPVTAVQILYVNLATDGLPALALAVDPADPDLMRRPPRKAARGIFTYPVVSLILVGGIWSTLVNLSLFAWARHSGKSDQEAMMMTFVSLVLIQFFKAYNFRSDRHSALRRPFANRWLNLAILWEVMLILAIVYLPVLQEAFGTSAMGLDEWGVILLAACSVAPVLEGVKYLVRRGVFGALEGDAHAPPR
ncbi:MAG TPA: cation-translocating P-type ATPase [Geomonas sp.]|nr:cation-translocating P-type ATPase [Geomonas sp.]